MSRILQIISIEGNIGSGKSTLLENMREHWKNDHQVVFLKEPVHEWESIQDSSGETMLQKFYANQPKYSFSFQMMAYITRLALLKRAIQDNPEATIFFTERSLYTDKYVFAKMLFDMGNMEDVNYQIYNRWFEEFAQDFPISGVIYVKTDPSICHERIRRRSREGEESIPLAYLQSCHNYHEGMISGKFSNVKKLEIYGNQDIYKDKNIMNRWIYEIEERFLRKEITEFLPNASNL